MEQDDRQLTPMMRQYESVKAQYRNEVLFFRLGDFYEMFNDDAVLVSRLLNLTLTHRAGQPMCGIPYHAAKVYIARLLRLGRKIVICEQVGEIPRGGKGITERKVVEVITPGTAVEDEYLDGNSASYLAAMSFSGKKAGFAYIDVSTGRFRATSWPLSSMSENFSKETGRVSPREFLLPESLRRDSGIQDVLQACDGISVSYYPDWNFSAASSFERLTSQFGTASLRAFSLEPDSPEVPPAGFLLDYLEKTTNTGIPHVTSIDVYHDSDFLIIDDSSRRNLEITENLRDGTPKYSLLECVDFTRTAMGSRLLRTWLLFPLTELAEITKRQDRTAFFMSDRRMLDTARGMLGRILDIERLASRIAMERAHPKDLQALRSSLEVWISLRKELSPSGFAFTDPAPAFDIINLINDSIKEDPPTAITDGGIIRDGWSAELDHWREIHDNFSRILSEYEAEERNKTGIQTLKIKYTNAAGYFIEVSKGRLSSVPPHFIMRRALVNGDRYTTARLQELEQELNDSVSKILELERDLYVDVRSRLGKDISYMLLAAGEIAETDVIASFAHAASVHRWVRPVMENSGIFEVKAGRHPVVENHIAAGEFVPNDTLLASGADGIPSFDLITGPNMAGKSTYLRQNALIALLAQTGSCVPAESARIGLADRIFCRVGASDNLARGESTFLVEMTETAGILRSATGSSIVIMDEVGRGTSTEDGLAIARAVSEYLLDTVKCRTLFATHYHELTRMEHGSVRMLCMDVAERDGGVVFLRKIKEGVTENSYGVHVARLAGVPKSVVDRADEILSHIQASSGPEADIPSPVRTERALPGLFSDEEMVLSEILSSEPDSMTPLEALGLIARWKKELSGR